MRHFKIPFLPIWISLKDCGETEANLASLEILVKAIIRKCGGRVDITKEEIEREKTSSRKWEAFAFAGGCMLINGYPYAVPDDSEILWLPHSAYEPISMDLYPSTEKQMELRELDKQAQFLMRDHGYQPAMGGGGEARPYSTSVLRANEIFSFVAEQPRHRRRLFWTHFGNMPKVMLDLESDGIAHTFTVLHSRIPEAATRALLESSKEWKDSDERVRNFRERHSKIDRSQGRAGAKVELGENEVPPWLRLEAMQPCEPEYIQTTDGSGRTAESGTPNPEHNQNWDNYRSIVYRSEAPSSSRPPAESMRHVSESDYNC